MKIAPNFHDFGSWSLFSTKRSRLCLANAPIQMSYPEVCQYVKTEILTGIFLSSLLVGIMALVEVNEAIGKIRSLLAVFCADCVFCCLRRKLSPTK